MWVADLTYIRDDDFNLYWASSPEARHSQAIEKNAAAACTITASFDPYDERALQIAGIAQKINDERFDLEKRLAQKRKKNTAEASGQLAAKGCMWYMLKPTRIELHHGDAFGKNRQTILL